MTFASPVTMAPPAGEVVDESLQPAA
jgi:hypothetical protein